MGSYREPEWAIPPSSTEWVLTEIKSGVEVARHPLKKATTILGRAVDMVHIPQHHQSISRQHARIAFDSNETPWLRDLQSAHGTTVNKRRLPAQTIGKTESNSNIAGARGVVLKVGDMIKLGASSRFFILDGPPPGATDQEKHLAELNRAAQQQKQASSATAATAKSSTNEGVSWGIDMGDEGAGSTETKTSKSIELDPTKIPEKYRKQLDQIQALKYKLANLENEDNRIRRKGELSEGQQKQLDRNAERETALRKSIQEKEERLQDKLSGSSSSRRTRTAHQNTYDDEDDEDYDFFDQTKNEGDSSELGLDGAESEESLTLKWKELSRERERLTSKASTSQQRVEQLRQKVKAMQASGNEEAFFVQNDLQLASEAKQKTETLLSKTNTSLDEIEKLLLVVNAKLQCDRSIGYIGEGPPPKTSEELQSSFQLPAMRPPLSKTMTSMGLPPAVQKSMGPPMGPPTRKTAMAPPAAVPNKTSATSMPPPTSLGANSLEMAPPTKRKRIIGPTAVPPSMSSDSKPPPSKTPRTGTLAFLDRPTTASNKAIKTADKKPAPGPKAYGQAPTDTSKMDVWRAPEGQDGSGKTKLNEKFAGRY